MTAAVTEVKTIVVVGQEALGAVPGGETMWAVDAQTYSGEVIECPLRSYSRLPEHEPIEVEIETSRSGKGSGGVHIVRLHDAAPTLRVRVRRLESEMEEMGRLLARLTRIVTEIERR